MPSPTTLNELYFGALDRFLQRPVVMRRKIDGRWIDLSYRGLADQVKETAFGLTALGITTGDRVAILSENRPEWAIADYACLSDRCTDVPIYPTLPAKQIEYLLNDSGAVAIFVSTQVQTDKILEIRANVPGLKHIFAMDATVKGNGVIAMDALREKGRSSGLDAGRWRTEALTVKPDDLATFIYTSGTTGDPKGVMLTHGNLTSNVVAGLSVLGLASSDECLSFLPLSHVFERMLDYSYFYRKTSIAYAESIDKLSANFVEVKPVCFGAVPRVYEKVQARIMANVDSGPGWKKKLFAWAVEIGKQRVPYMESGKALPAGLARKAKIADALVFKKIRARLGGRFQFAVSGGAPLSRALAEFFIGAGVQIYEGYGLTETSPVICVSGPGRWRLGTVGRAIRNVQVKIAEDGEILTRGPHVMKGYFNKPDATAEAIDKDGWFHTGDIGNLDADGFLAITDRKKDLIVLANGKKAAPQPIENELKKSPFISLPVVIGDRQKFLAALIVPDFDKLKEWVAAGHLQVDWLRLDANPDVRRLYQREIDTYNADKAHHEQIRAFAILPADLTIEDGSITPTLKVKRRILESRYHGLIESMYNSAGNPNAS